MNTVNTATRKNFGFNESFDRFPIAMAYVPWQRLTNIYEDLDEAFENGTIFPELNQPFSGRRCCK
ncbi:MAG: spore coat associated protein CotJA [Lachnospiraceae bacterium]|nr:spore coat associated protein CotJA [Lachnospiraceae bacterium]